MSDVRGDGDDRDMRDLRLFKYRALGEGSRDYTRRLIVDGEIYFASRSELNDPFDCRPYVHTRATKEQRLKYFRGMARRRMVGVSRQERIAWAASVAGDGDANQRLTTSFYDVIDRMGIFSVSRVPDDVLMWAHYGHGHRGVCVELNAGALHALGHCPFPVEYTERRPHIDPVLEGATALIEKGLLTKAKPWEYEQEWRSVSRGFTGSLQLPADGVQSVLIGALALEQDVDEVLRWVSERAVAVPVSRARFGDEMFGLEFEDLA